MAIEGRVDPRCEPIEGAVRKETQLGRFRPQASLGWVGDWEVAPMPCRGAGGARMVAWVAVWWLGWPFVRVRTREGRSRATSEKRRYWEDFGPRPPWGGWVAGGRPRGRASMPGGDFWWLGWPRGDLGGRSPVLPPVGRVKNARKTTAGASGQADRRSKRTNPQLRAACGAASKQARARMLIAARASREPRATSRVIPASGERRNPHPEQQQGRPLLRADVRTRDVA